MKKIILKEDFYAEVQIFYNFLNSKEYPQHRNIIFSTFPELKEKIEQQAGEEKTIVVQFLKKTREYNIDNIQKSVSYIENEIKKFGEKALEILCQLMDVNINTGEETYFLTPTILPFSPFKNNTFFYSIYKSLKGATEFPKVLSVSVHEISHMMLFDILNTNNIKLSRELLYFIKELIAPILVYQDNFAVIFKKEVVGNYNVLEIYLNDNDKTVKAFDYFLEMFLQNRSENQDFLSFLKKMISICQKIKTEIKEKKDFDNKYGMKIMSDPELLKKFREPIKLNS